MEGRENPSVSSTETEQSQNDEIQFSPVPSTSTTRRNPFSASFEDQEIRIDRPTCSILFDTYDQVLAVVGGLGRYQLAFMLVYMATTIEFAGNYVLLQLSVYQPEATCYFIDGDGQNTSLTLNKSEEQEFCAIFNAGNCSELKWTSHFASTAFHTIIEEWALICDKAYVAPLINTLALIGPLIVNVIMGALSDRFGRKLMCCVNLAALVISNAVNCTATSWQAYTAARVAAIAFTYSIIVIMFIWAMECTPSSHGMFTNLAGMWHIGYIGAGALALLVDGWRSYLIALNIAAVPLISCLFGIVESPSWLIQMGHLEKASTALNTISSFNKKPAHATKLSPLNLRNIQKSTSRNFSNDDESEDAKSGVLDQIVDTVKMLCHKRTLFYIMLLATLVVAVSGSTNAYMFQISRFDIEPHFTVIIYGIMRLVLMPPVVYLDHKCPLFGRRHLVCSSLGLTVLCFIGAFVMDICWPDEDPAMYGYDVSTGDYRPSTLMIWRTYVLMLGAATACNFLWVALGQLYIELFPSVQRGRVGAIMATFDQVVTIAMPQLVYAEHFWQPILLLFCVVVTSVALISAYTLLPETKGAPMPDDLEEHQQRAWVGNTLIHGKVCRWVPERCFRPCNCCCDQSADENQLLDNIENDH